MESLIDGGTWLSSLQILDIYGQVRFFGLIQMDATIGLLKVAPEQTLSWGCVHNTSFSL